MNDLPPSLVLLASAGTGKTYRLSLRYLKLLVEGAAPESILASTFTRKAAGEILGAILGRLAVACRDAEKRATLAKELGLAKDWSQESAIALLERLLQHLPQVNIRTLDSWFQSQVAAAGLELGLPLGWRLAEEVDQTAIHREAVERTILDLAPDEALELLAAMQSGKAKRSLLGRGADTLQQAAALYRAADGAEEPWQLLAAVRAPTAAEIAAAQAALDLIEMPLTAKGTPRQHWGKALPALQQAFADGDLDTAPDNGLLKKMFEGATTYDRAELPRELLEAAAQACARHLLAELHHSNQALYRLAARYEAQRQTAMRAAALIEYDDFPASLAACPAERRQAIARRAGATPDHLLLDEFQDTSVLQWQALEALAMTAVAAEQQSLFVVGDVKQSIYGFREGEPRLLAGLSEWLHIPSETMAVNYRSRQAILDAVNFSFTDLPQRFPAEEFPVRAAAAAAWDGFPQHRASSQAQGCVRVWQLYGEKADDKEVIHRATLARTLELHRAHPQQTLAILVRNNKVIPRLLAELTAAGVRASGAGGNALTDAHAVACALSLFQLADHPRDTAAWFHLATSPLAPLLNLAYRHGDMRLEDARRASRDLRRRLLQEGYGGLLEKLHRDIQEAEAFDPFNRRRFGQLVELGLAWDERADLRPVAFVAMVRERKVADRGAGAVQVMTVHQSKGLAFDRVVLPLPGKSGGRDTLFGVRPDPRRAMDAVSRVPNTAQRQAATLLEQDRFLQAASSQQVRDIQDMLCLLYVAMTRARTEMEILLPPEAKSATERLDKLKPAEFLQRTLLAQPSPVELPEPEAVAKKERTWRLLWQLGASPAATATPMEPPIAPTVSAEEANTPLFLPSHSLRNLPRWTPSAAEDTAIAGQQLLQIPDADAMRRGSALHLLFAEIGFLPEMPDAPALASCLQALDPPPTTAEQSAWLQEFHSMLQQPTIQATLTAPASSNPPPELWRERPFAVRTKDVHGQEALLQGIYDRVVLHHDEGGKLRAQILDFKTGQPSPDGSMPETYRRQLAAYRRALSLQLALPEEGIETALLYLDADLFLNEQG